MVDNWEPRRTKGQVALEGNFRFVLDKSDLISASDKKFVQKATVTLKNKICEQNTKHNTMLWAHSWTKSFSSSLLHLSWAFLFSADEDARREEDEVDAGIELSSLNWRDSGNESVLVVEGDGLAGISSIINHVRAWQRIDPSWWILWIFVRKKIGRPRRDSRCCEMRT